METANAGNFEVGCNVEERNGTEAIKERRVKRFFFNGNYSMFIYSHIYQQMLKWDGEIRRRGKNCWNLPLEWIKVDGL